jgi:putative acyl-CoA dehydrogenase
MPGTQPGFIQAPPSLAGVNTFEADALLKAFLAWRMGDRAFAGVRAELSRFGARCGSDIRELGERAEAERPVHVPFDAWGRRVDRLELSSAWKALDRVAAEEGLVAIGYERKLGELSRLHQFAKLYLFHVPSAFYTCPLAMTDGAARVLELFGSAELKSGAFRRLTSRDPAQFWTSGQWMTEKTGGSDVSGTSTIARASAGGAGGAHAQASAFELRGDKWFTSATSSQMAMALAKVEGATDSRGGLSLFYLELRDEHGELRNIRIHRLKDKLGTKALPTAELSLEGTPGVLVGEVGEGVKKVASMLNITRLYNSVTAIGTMAHALLLAKDYASKRFAFGKALAEQPLHLQTLADMQCEHEATFLLGFHLIHLLGKDETGQATLEEGVILRLLTPVIKLWSAKQAILIASETIECIGGAGYIEDTGLPRLLRDSQVFSIWEGTTNVLSLDVLRAIAKENALTPFFADVERRLIRSEASLVQASAERVVAGIVLQRQLSSNATAHASASARQGLALEIAKVREALVSLKAFAGTIGTLSPDSLQAQARALSFGLARTSAAALLIEFASSGTYPKAAESARRFCRRPLVELYAPEELSAERIKAIVFG